MNIFQYFGDSTHLLAIFMLLIKLWKSRSCAGISGKTQILFALAYTARYLDLFTSFISVYNTVLKIIFLLVTYTTILMIYWLYKATYDHNHDTVRIEFLLIPTAILAFLVNHDFSPLEIFWTFSIYLESVAILPQLFMVYKIGADNITYYYLFALGSYRGLYIFNWIYSYNVEGYYDMIAVFAGVVQVTWYFIFLFLYSTKGTGYLNNAWPFTASHKFFDYLQNLKADDVTLCAIDHGKPVHKNALAVKVFKIKVEGTFTHVFFSSYTSVDDLLIETLKNKDTGEEVNLLEVALTKKNELAGSLHLNQSDALNGEMAAFISLAISYPERFVALVDAYDVIKSGILNFCSVALALNDAGYRAIGIRIDSGDVAYLNGYARSVFVTVGKEFGIDWFGDLVIIAGSNIRDTIISLNEQYHMINSFDEGNYGVTFQRQPSFRSVGKLIEKDSTSKAILSQKVSKMAYPWMKSALRLLRGYGHALIDLMQSPNKEMINAESKVLPAHPLPESKQAYVCPAAVELLPKTGSQEMLEHQEKSKSPEKSEPQEKSDPDNNKAGIFYDV